MHAAFFLLAPQEQEVEPVICFYCCFFDFVLFSLNNLLFSVALDHTSNQVITFCTWLDVLFD